MCFNKVLPANILTFLQNYTVLRMSRFIFHGILDHINIKFVVIGKKSTRLVSQQFVYWSSIKKCVFSLVPSDLLLKRSEKELFFKAISQTRF